MKLGIAYTVPVFLYAQMLDDCRAHRHRGELPEARACFARLASGSDPYLRAEGLWGLEQYREANDQFRDAVKQHPKSVEYRVRWGRLFLERFNKDEAKGLFEEALEINKDDAGASLGLALVAAEGFSSAAVHFATRATELDPKMAEARELLAYLALEDNDPERAAKEADKALAIDRESLDAMAIHATIDWLNDQNRIALDGSHPQDQSGLRRSVLHRRPLLRLESPLPGGHRATIARRSI